MTTHYTTLFYMSTKFKTLSSLFSEKYKNMLFINRKEKLLSIRLYIKHFRFKNFKNVKFKILECIIIHGISSEFKIREALNSNF